MRVLDLEWEIQGFNTHWSNIFYWIFLFSRSKASDAKFGINNFV